MNKPTRTLQNAAFALLTSTSVLLASTEHLTPQRIDELTAPADSLAKKTVVVEVSDLGKVKLSKDLEGTLELIREYHYPVKFDPPQVSKNSEHQTIVIPATPNAFAQINVGWTVHLKAWQVGKVVMLSASADYVDVKPVKAGYGELAGEVKMENRDVTLTPNVMNQPLQHTTSSRFQLSALPGKTYTVLLYQGDKAVKKQVKVSLE